MTTNQTLATLRHLQQTNPESFEAIEQVIDSVRSLDAKKERFETAFQVVKTENNALRRRCVQGHPSLKASEQIRTQQSARFDAALRRELMSPTPVDEIELEALLTVHREPLDFS